MTVGFFFCIADANQCFQQQFFIITEVLWELVVQTLAFARAMNHFELFFFKKRVLQSIYSYKANSHWMIFLFIKDVYIISH